MFGTVWGYAECYWILNRKRNERRITPAAFSLATTQMDQELLTPGGFNLLSIEDDRVLAGLPFIRRYSLNSNDAAILATFLRYRRSLPPGSPPCVLAAADGRLLRAAQSEGLAGLNPELVAEADVLAFLARLA